jgi:hypothetical protein
MLPINSAKTVPPDTQRIASGNYDLSIIENPALEAHILETGEESLENQNTLAEHTLRDSVRRGNAIDISTREEKQMFFDERLPDDIQREINKLLSFEEKLNLAKTDKFNNERSYRMAQKPDFLVSKVVSFFPSSWQSIIEPIARNIEEFIGPKKMAETFIESLADHSLSKTQSGRNFLKLHHIDSPLAIRRLDNATSTTQQEIQKRTNARNAMELASANNYLNYHRLNNTLYPEEDGVEHAITLLADELMTIEQLTQFCTDVSIPVNLPYYLKHIYEPLASGIISSRQLVEITITTILGLDNLCNKAVRDALSDGLLTLDQLGICGYSKAALEEAAFSKEIIKLGLKEGHEAFVSKLNEYHELRYMADILDLSEDALRSRNKNGLTFEDIAKRAEQLYQMDRDYRKNH